MLRETIDFLEDRIKSQPDFNYEIIIVDDGSKDETSQVALKYSKEISIENCRVLTLGRPLICYLLVLVLSYIPNYLYGEIKHQVSIIFQLKT